MYSKNKATEFASRWMPAWSGNKPLELAEYYSEDCFYMDAGCPKGVNGKKKLIKYFTKLLSQNPKWKWEQIEPIPMENGFLNKWKATIPVGNKDVLCIGVCFVQFDKNDKIKRNEVYFDRTELVNEIFKLNQK